MFNLIKILVALFVVLGLGVAVTKSDSGDAGGSSFTLFDDLPTEAGDDDPPKRKKKGGPPSGIVIESRDGALVILPWKDGGPVEVYATAGQRDRCPLDARYPDCL